MAQPLSFFPMGLRTLDNLQTLWTGGINIAMHYWLAYAFASFRFLMGNFDKNTPMADPLTHHVPPLHEWLRTTEAESRAYLRSGAFSDSLATFISALLELRQPRYMLPAYLDYLFDQYLGALAGNLLELQETPHQVAYKKQDVRLLRYNADPQPTKRYRTPLLIVYAPINRYHIMDIRKGRSIVEQFLLGGFDVFLLDWGSQQNNKPALSDYIGYIHDSVEQIKKITGSEKVNILGYSWGGVLASIYTSVMADKVENLILQSAHIDFDKDDSVLASWFRKLPVEKIVGELDWIDCRFINLALIMRNPAVHLWDPPRFGASMNEGSDGTQVPWDSLRVAAWLGDTPVIPAGVFEGFIKNLYQENQLVQKKLKVEIGEDEKIADLKNIMMPLLTIVGNLDDICPPTASLPITSLASSKDNQAIEFPSGHIELSVSELAHKELWPQVVEWLQKRSS